MATVKLTTKVSITMTTVGLQAKLSTWCSNLSVVYFLEFCAVVGDTLSSDIHQKMTVQIWNNLPKTVRSFVRSIDRLLVRLSPWKRSCWPLFISLLFGSQPLLAWNFTTTGIFKVSFFFSRTLARSFVCSFVRSLVSSSIYLLSQNSSKPLSSRRAAVFKPNNQRLSRTVLPWPAYSTNTTLCIILPDL